MLSLFTFKLVNLGLLKLVFVTYTNVTTWIMFTVIVTLYVRITAFFPLKNLKLNGQSHFPHSVNLIHFQITQIVNKCCTSALHSKQNNVIWACAVFIWIDVPKLKFHLLSSLYQIILYNDLHSVLSYTSSTHFAFLDSCFSVELLNSFFALLNVAWRVQFIKQTLM